ncbi:hypothetical protein PHMEG_00028688 [Phytophthora megakarya]|uniref:Uncharacterized protein n=1 Tax=Phytophthora megakarya TaxID=4795 RepID=A0A225V4F7_9STRA|nr:hypothetical protein PHMEG_00028688 [Phytophthora megakarya]
MKISYPKPAGPRIRIQMNTKRTIYGRIYRDVLVHLCGYKDPTWVDKADINCGALLYEIPRDRTNRNLFGVMQSHEKP